MCQVVRDANSQGDRLRNGDVQQGPLNRGGRSTGDHHSSYTSGAKTMALASTKLKCGPPSAVSTRWFACGPKSVIMDSFLL